MQGKVLESTETMSELDNSLEVMIIVTFLATVGINIHDLVLVSWVC